MAGATPAAPVQTKEIRIIKFIPNGTTVEPWYNEGLKDKQNVLAFKRFRYSKVLFHIFYNQQPIVQKWGLHEAPPK